MTQPIDEQIAANRALLKVAYRAEYLAGAEAACCEYAGYPKGFASWLGERRNAWWAGWNEGYSQLHSKPGTLSDPSEAEQNRQAWQKYRRWEEGEIKAGKLKPNELTGRADALTHQRLAFETTQKASHGGKTNKGKTRLAVR